MSVTVAPPIFGTQVIVLAVATSLSSVALGIAIHLDKSASFDPTGHLSMGNEVNFQGQYQNFQLTTAVRYPQQR